MKKFSLFILILIILNIFFTKNIFASCLLPSPCSSDATCLYDQSNQQGKACQPCSGSDDANSPFCFCYPNALGCPQSGTIPPPTSPSPTPSVSPSPSPSTLPPSSKAVPFKPTRLVKTTDTAPSNADAVKFSQSGSLAPYQTERKIIRAGFMENFSDLTIPFARDLTSYLVGPFLFQGNTAIFDLLKSNRPETAGVLSKLTPSSLQDMMRKDYWQKCKDGTYCSSLNIGPGNLNCPTPESNECLIADGRDISGLTPPPDWQDQIYRTDPERYDKDLSTWRWEERDKPWAQVPLISNPKTLVEGAVKMASCDAADGTSVNTKTPWASALKDTSVFLADLLLPQKSGKTVSQESTFLSVSRQNSSQVLGEQTPLVQACSQDPFYKGFSSSTTDIGNGQFKICWSISPGVNDSDHNYCDWGYKITVSLNGQEVSSFREPLLPLHCFSWKPTIICEMGSARPIVVSAKPSDKIDVYFTITNGLCTGPCCAQFDPKNTGGEGGSPGPGGTPPPPAPCKPPAPPPFKPDGASDPVEAEGHALVVGPEETLHCKKWTVGFGEVYCSDPEGKPDAILASPVWPVVDYPYLETIYEKLSGPEGIFQALFKPAEIETKNWDFSGESGLNYCVKDVQDYAWVEPDADWNNPAYLSGGGLYPYKPDNMDINSPAHCGKLTKNLRVYPQKIGGVKNAQEWVIEALNP